MDKRILNLANEFCVSDGNIYDLVTSVSEIQKELDRERLIAGEFVEAAELI